MSRRKKIRRRSGGGTPPPGKNAAHKNMLRSSSWTEVRKGFKQGRKEGGVLPAKRNEPAQKKAATPYFWR